MPSSPHVPVPEETPHVRCDQDQLQCPVTLQVMFFLSHPALSHMQRHPGSAITATYPSLRRRRPVRCGVTRMHPRAPSLQHHPCSTIPAVLSLTRIVPYPSGSDPDLLPHPDPESTGRNRCRSGRTVRPHGTPHQNLKPSSQLTGLTATICEQNSNPST